MVIDLGRNDVGWVSEAGSVSLADNMVIERYSHVMHIVPIVTGRAREGISAVDALPCRHERSVAPPKYEPWKSLMSLNR